MTINTAVTVTMFVDLVRNSALFQAVNPIMGIVTPLLLLQTLSQILPLLLQALNQTLLHPLQMLYLPQLEMVLAHTVAHISPVA